MSNFREYLNDGIESAIAWITNQGHDDWLCKQYRSPQLMTADDFDAQRKPDIYSYTRMQGIVDDVLKLRRQLVDELQLARHVDVSSGRLLRHNFGETTCTAEPMELTNGFFDCYDVPAWDTWVTFLADDSRPSSSRGFLVAWIPDMLVKNVDEAVRYSFEENNLWLE